MEEPNDNGLYVAFGLIVCMFIILTIPVASDLMYINSTDIFKCRIDKANVEVYKSESIIFVRGISIYQSEEYNNNVPIYGEEIMFNEVCDNTDSCYKLLIAEYRNQTNIDSPLVRLCVKRRDRILTNSYVITRYLLDLSSMNTWAIAYFVFLGFVIICMCGCCCLWNYHYCYYKLYEY